MTMKNILFFIAAIFILIDPALAQTIQTNQAITISIQGVPERDRATINNTYPVSQSGTINMPYIGTVRAAGLLPEQLAASLQAQYRNAQIYSSPTFQVIATSSDTIVNQIVTVGGDVRRPGPVPFTNGITLWQALQAAGGETEFGSIRRVRLFRDGNTREYDLRKPEQMQIRLRPNDTIQVPRKNWIGQ
jgi:polysaccharide export outer membrane protein